jgi:hypothetical protein
LSYLRNVTGMERRDGVGPYLAGAALARVGDEMSGPALLLAGLATTGSAASASALLAGLTVSAAAGGPVFGALLDRSARPGRVLATALALYASGLAVVLASLGRLPVACTVLLAVPTGLLGPALSGGWTSQLPLVVGPDALARAHALDAMTFSLASLLGPALAGAVADLCGATAGVEAAVALIALALPGAWRLPRAATRASASASATATATATARGPDPTSRPTPGTATGRATVPVPASGRSSDPATVPAPVTGKATAPDPEVGRAALPRATSAARPAPTAAPAPSRRPPLAPLAADLAAGLRAVLHTRRLARATTVSTLSCTGGGILVAAGPLLGESVFGSAARGTLLLSCTAASALAANALLARRPRALPPDTVLWVGTLLLGCALLLASTLRPWAVIAAMPLIGAAEGPQLTALFAVRHRDSPAAVRAQVFTTGASLKITGYAVGAALCGPLAARSLPAALLTAAGFHGLAVVAHWAMRPAPTNRPIPPVHRLTPPGPSARPVRPKGRLPPGAAPPDRRTKA